KQICVGFLREYVFIDPKETHPKSLLQTGITQKQTHCLSVPSDEVMIVKENIGITVGLNGVISRDHGFIWDELPSHLAYLEPYLIAVVEDQVEIKYMGRKWGTKTDQHIQSFELKGVVATSAPNAIDYDKRLLDRGWGFGIESDKKIDTSDTIDPDFRLFIATKKDVYILAQTHIFR